MKLFTIIVTTIVISMVFEQTPINTEARRLRKKDGQDHFKASSSNELKGNSLGIGHKKSNVNVEGLQDDFKPTEGRRLQKTRNGQDHFKTGTTDDFAPTTPGNSPGVGHRKKNENVQRLKDDFKPTEERRLQKTNGQDHYKTGSTDDFAPTAPGNSPGVGHKKMNVNVKEVKDDLEPTEERPLQKTNDQDHFKTGSTDDFAPTSPGNSPGMGHKKGDDFKPTTPGHSPGVGHAVKNDEPKA
ncbi:Precursor of CEP9 [Cardamine amara subsp. amara]|uniref:Precursor of CEP9 n=1 Tax=Cardamine amara subsp. amara TaxID=228776 RepID=A0ABD1B5Y1_CARAN